MPLIEQIHTCLLDYYCERALGLFLPLVRTFQEPIIRKKWMISSIWGSTTNDILSLPLTLALLSIIRFLLDLMKLHPRKFSDLILNLNWKEKNMPETENHIKAQKSAKLNWWSFSKTPKGIFFATLYVDRKLTAVLIKVPIFHLRNMENQKNS